MLGYLEGEKKYFDSMCTLTTQQKGNMRGSDDCSNKDTKLKANVI